MNARDPNSQGSEPWLRPRRQRRRQRRHFRLGPAFAAGAPGTGASQTRPTFSIREPAPGRNALISGSLSVLAHGSILGFLALSAWLAPEVVEKIIPVRIIREAPEPPPPPVARRVVVPRRALARTRVPTSVPRPRTVPRPEPRPVTARAVKPESIQATAAPTPLAQRRVTSQRVLAQRPLATPNRVAVDRVVAPTIVATDLQAPAVEITGPREVTPGAALEVTAPDAFRNYSESTEVDYTTAVTAPTAASEVPTAETGFVIDAELEEGAKTWGKTGGTGNAAFGAPCMQRASVVRYYKEYVEQRTRAEWRQSALPTSIDADARVVLHFVLDETGSASAVSVVSAPTTALGASCKQALISAAPFPSMDEDVRCLAGRKLSGTFTIPVRGASAP